MSTRSRQDSLLAALQRKAAPATPVAPPPEAHPETTPPEPASPAEPPVSATASQPSVPAPDPKARPRTPANAEKPPQKKARRVGKPVQFWLHEEDRMLVRELAAWLAGQGIRPTDSMVVRAALRMAKTGPGFLEAYRKAALLDGRLKPRS